MWLTLLWSLWLMSPWRACLLMLQGHTRWTSTWWTGTHGEMISSDLHGAKSPPDGCWDPDQGQRQIRGLHQRERRTFHRGHPGRSGPKGVVSFTPWCRPWKAHDITQVTHYITQCFGCFGGSCVPSGTCGKILRPKEAYNFSIGSQHFRKRA